MGQRDRAVNPSQQASEIRVLVIEDNAEHSSLLARLLGNAPFPKFKVREAQSLQEGIGYLVAEKFDLVMLDLWLSDSQGMATFEAVGRVAADLPIVVLSGIADVSLAIETVQKGAQDYLVKGHVDNHLLLRSIQYALERKRVEVALKSAHDELEARVRQRTWELSEMNQRLQREVRERKRAEELALESNQQLMTAVGELQSMQRDLVRRERFQALAQMANGIAHEFNNVLTPIVGFADYLLQHEAVMEGPDQLRQNLQQIRAAAMAGSKAVSRVRDFARAEAGEFGPVSVRDLITNVVTMTEPRWHDEALAVGCTLSVDTAVDAVADVHGDFAQLSEVLTHLVFNAVAAIDRRGTIRIGAERRGGGVVIFVEDDGRGMSETQRRHCLDPKANAGAIEKRVTGYAVVHSIVARHHGRLEIESEEGRGTWVGMVLPALPQPVEVEVEPPPVVATPEPEGLRILVVDDEPMVREVIQLYLREDGHEVVVAENGADALKKFQEGEFSLVLTDRAMPELSGDQLALEVKKLRPEIPVILLTGFGDLMHEEGEQPPGVDSVISKPFTMKSLHAAVRQICSTR